MNKTLDPLTTPDVLILDMSLGERYTGPEVCRTIRSQNSKTAILGITSFPLKHYAADIALAGAQGIVSKADMHMIALGINHIRHGGVFSPIPGIDFETSVVAHKRIPRKPAGQKPLLSTQETRVMELLCKGLKYSQIAAKLGNKESSIRTEAHRAVKKLGANTLSQAVAMWVLEQKS